MRGEVQTIDTVQKKHLNRPLYVVQVGGQQYEYGVNEPNFSVGDEIEFEEYEKWGTKRMKDVSSIGAGGVTAGPFNAPQRKQYGANVGKTFPVPLLHGDRSIIRQNALAHATRVFTELANSMTREDVNVVLNLSIDEQADRIIALARKFEEYSAGDIERRAAEKKMVSIQGQQVGEYADRHTHP